MVMKKNVMAKNLTQSILRSFGRYLAIVLIIALGSALFVGLLMTKADMVETGQVFTDEQNMFDLRLLSSYGWTEEQLEKARALEGVADVEAAKYQDALVRVGDRAEEQVYRFYSIPQTVNRVDLRGGRMPQAPDECLADGFQFDDSILGTQVFVSAGNEETALDALAYDTYTVVGYVSTPLYMDPNRGSTSIGSGSLTSYFYLSPEGFSADYYTEINVTIPGNHAIYSQAYNDTLDAMAEALKPQVQQIADEWFAELLAEAEAEYADGYRKYLDGVADLEQGKLDAQRELDDAYNQLRDARQEIRDNEALLSSGAQQLADGKEQLDGARRELDAGWKELEQARADTYAQLEAAQAELDTNAAQVEDGLAQINEGLPQLEEGLSQVADGISQLEPIMQLVNPLVKTARQMVNGVMAMPDLGIRVVLRELESRLPGMESAARSGLDRLVSSGVVSEETASTVRGMFTGFDHLQNVVGSAVDGLSEYPDLREEMLDAIDRAMDELESTVGGYADQLNELYAMRTQLEQQRAELAAARRTLQRQAQEWEKAHERLNCIVMGAQDEMIRCILSRYYLHGDSWQQVAAHIGGGNSPDGVRKLAARYLASLH